MRGFRLQPEGCGCRANSHASRIFPAEAGSHTPAAGSRWDRSGPRGGQAICSRVAPHLPARLQLRRTSPGRAASPGTGLLRKRRSTSTPRPAQRSPRGRQQAGILTTRLMKVLRSSAESGADAKLPCALDDAVNADHGKESVPGLRRHRLRIQRTAKRRSCSRLSTCPSGRSETGPSAWTEGRGGWPAGLLRSPFVRGRTPTAYARSSGAVAKW